CAGLGAARLPAIRLVGAPDEPADRVGERGRARGVDADEVPLYLVATAGDQHAGVVVARDQVRGPGRGPADHIRVSGEQLDTVTVAHRRDTGRVDADVIPRDAVAAGRQHLDTCGVAGDEVAGLG